MATKKKPKPGLSTQVSSVLEAIEELEALTNTAAALATGTGDQPLIDCFAKSEEWLAAARRCCNRMKEE